MASGQNNLHSENPRPWSCLHRTRLAVLLLHSGTVDQIPEPQLSSTESCFQTPFSNAFGPTAASSFHPRTSCLSPRFNFSAGIRQTGNILFHEYQLLDKTVGDFLAYSLQYRHDENPRILRVPYQSTGRKWRNEDFSHPSTDYNPPK
jgi:hypothetical protein